MMPRHLHAAVHFSAALLQLHRPDVHPLVHPQVIISVQLSGIGVKDVSFGRSLSLSLTQPRVCGDGREGFAYTACLHTVAW